jgi:hypothetical protein
VHFQVNVPKCYSLEEAEIMLKSHSAKKMFEQHPGFQKLYPNGGFWSGYEHHGSNRAYRFRKINCVLSQSATTSWCDSY